MYCNAANAWLCTHSLYLWQNLRAKPCVHIAWIGALPLRPKVGRGGLGPHASCYPVSAVGTFFVFSPSGMLTPNNNIFMCSFFFLCFSWVWLLWKLSFGLLLHCGANLGLCGRPGWSRGQFSRALLSPWGTLCTPKVSPREPEDRPNGPGIVFCGCRGPSWSPKSEFSQICL